MATRVDGGMVWCDCKWDVAWLQMWWVARSGVAISVVGGSVVM